MTDPLNDVRTRAQTMAPALVEQYRAIWTDLWAQRETVGRMPMEQVRAVLLGFLVDGVPADTARMVATEFMKGLAK